MAFRAHIISLLLLVGALNFSPWNHALGKHAVKNFKRVRVLLCYSCELYQQARVMVVGGSASGGNRQGLVSGSTKCRNITIA